MLLDVVLEKRFYRCSQGIIWTDNAFAYPFWQRYLVEFDSVNIVARVHPVTAVPAEWQPVCGPNVTLSLLPGYVGLAQFLRSFPATCKALYLRRGQADRALYRIPGVLAWLYQLCAGRKGLRYGAEVVGDPADTFAPGASTSRFSGLFATLFGRMLRAQCRGAVSIAYVTESALQRRYPPAPQAFHTHYSSIMLFDEDYQCVTQYTRGQSVKLLCVGNLSQPYKGCDLMLQALAQLNRESPRQFQLTWVGGGALLESMQKLASELGVFECVTFTGNVAQRARIRALMDQSDVFVLPSRQEGLPRVLIEAMARSRLCVGTNVGGVAELLRAPFLVPKDNVTALAEAIVHCTRLPEAQKLQCAEANYQKAREFHNGVLSQRRQQMYRHLKGAA